MKLVADENVDRQIVDELRSHGHDVTTSRNWNQALMTSKCWLGVWNLEHCW
jgi:hypothetical protein